MLDRIMDRATARALIEPLYVGANMAPRDVARALVHCITYEQVIRITSNIRKNRCRTQTSARRGGSVAHTLNIGVSKEVYARLQPYAERRTMSVSRLAARIVDAAVDCVDAVLDDLH